MRDLLPSKPPTPGGRRPWRCFVTRPEVDRLLRRRLGGLDTLVFAGRHRRKCVPGSRPICDGLGFLGIEIDQAARGNRARDFHSSQRVTVRVIRHGRRLMIARSVCRILKLGISEKTA